MFQSNHFWNRFTRWWSGKWRKPKALRDHRSIQQLARELPDEVAEAMSSRMKLDAERHRKRGNEE